MFGLPYEFRRIAIGKLGALALASLCLSPAWSACGLPPADSPQWSPFQVRGDVVLDLRSGQLWKRCSIGQTYYGNSCHGTALKMDWAGAQGAAAAVGDGWRLPTKAELASLVLPYCSNPVTDPAVFPETPQVSFWSENPDSGDGVLFLAFDQAGAKNAPMLRPVSYQPPAAAVRLVLP
jgi:hypothetical protein